MATVKKTTPKPKSKKVGVGAAPKTKAPSYDPTFFNADGSLKTRPIVNDTSQNRNQYTPEQNRNIQNNINNILKNIKQDSTTKANPWSATRQRNGGKTIKAKSGAKMMVKSKAKVSKAKYGTKKKK
jgi:hypothetical protein